LRPRPTHYYVLGVMHGHNISQQDWTIHFVTTNSNCSTNLLNYQRLAYMRNLATHYVRDD